MTSRCAGAPRCRAHRPACRRRRRPRLPGSGFRAVRAPRPRATRRAGSAHVRRAPPRPARSLPRQTRVPCHGTGDARPRGRGPRLHDTRHLRCGAMDDSSLARYADAIVRDGLLIGPGDVLSVHPEPVQRPFAVALTEAGYRAGARYVDVLEDDPRITRARTLLAPEETLDWRPAWQDARMRELVRENAGIVWIAGAEDPQALADVPPARAVRKVVDRPGLAPYRRAVGR